MRIGSAFPSKWLKADDLQGRRIKVVIDRVVMEDVGGGEDKPVMYFQGKDKGLVLNRTNSGRCEMAWGTDETDDWTGKEIYLKAEPVMFQGRTVQGLRIQVPEPEPVAVDDDSAPF